MSKKMYGAEIAESKYVSALLLLAPYWNKPCSELPENLRELVSPLWDMATLEGRRSLAMQHDEQYDPAMEIDRQSCVNFGYFSAIARDTGEVDWAGWILPYLTSREAACLLIELDPKNYNHVKSNNSPKFVALAEWIDKVERVATREQETGLLPEKTTPSQWIEWAQGKGYVVPQQFFEAVVGNPVRNSVTISAKAKGGRPKTIEKKAHILRLLIERMTNGNEIDPSNLPGSASNLFEACRRIEKEKSSKEKIFDKGEGAFRTWLNAAGYRFGDGRTPDNEARYWTLLCVQTMGLIEAEVFTGVIPEKPL